MSNPTCLVYQASVRGVVSWSLCSLSWLRLLLYKYIHYIYWHYSKTTSTSASVTKSKGTTNRANKSPKCDNDNNVDLSAEKVAKKNKKDLRLKEETTYKEKSKEEDKPPVRRNAINFDGDDDDDDDDDDHGMQVVQNTGSSNQGVVDVKPTLKAAPNTSYRQPYFFGSDEDD